MRFSLPRINFRKVAWTVFKATFFLTALATIITTIFGIVVNIRGNRNWREYRTDAERRGVKMELKDFLLPPVPPEENFAALPIFEKLFADRERGLQSEHPLKLPEYPKFPPMTGAAGGVLADLEPFRQYFLKSNLLGKGAAEAGNAAEVILRSVATCESHLAQLREGSRRPFCRFPVHWEDGPSADLPHIDVLSAAAHLGTLRALVYCVEGRSDEALAEIETIGRYEGHLHTQSQVISAVVSLRFHSNVCDIIWEGLARSAWNRDQLMRIEELLRHFSPFQNYRESLQGERVVFNVLYSQLADRHAPGRERMLERSETFFSSRADRFPAELGGWVRENQVLTNRHFDELASRVDVEKGRFFPERETPSDGQHVASGSIWARRYYSLHFICDGIYEDIERRVVHRENLVRQARIACALERYRLEHSTYPRTLQELQPPFLAAASHDVITGEPFRYQVKVDGRFCLYSVALNRVDDGGSVGFQRPDRKTVAEDVRQKRETNPTRQLDWVWEYPPPPASR